MKISIIIIFFQGFFPVTKTVQSIIYLPVSPYDIVPIAPDWFLGSQCEHERQQCESQLRV